MNAKKRMIEELRACTSEYVTYGDGDLGIPILREEAIQDIMGMDEDTIGEGTWYPCGEDGLTLGSTRREL